MKELKFTKQTSTVALVFFIAYVIYGIFYTPLVQLVISLAVAGIAYGMTDSYEVAVIVLLLINYLFPFYRGSNMKGVTAYNMEGFANANPKEVTKRIQQMMGHVADPIVDGVGSKLSEGFADAGDSDLTLNENKEKGENSKPISASSKPSELDSSDASGKEEQLKKMTEMMGSMLKTMNKGTDLANTPSIPSIPSIPKATKISEQDMPAVHQPQDVKPEEKKKEKFENQTSEGLFKLGQIPKDAKGGFHIDAGTTVMNAINSLKPDQIKAMTQDTKQLIDTQKSLMSMLQTFQPMVQEGKQMMDTFQEMFSPSMGATSK